MAERFSKAYSQRFLPLHVRPRFLEPRRLSPLPSLVGLHFWFSCLLGLAWRYLIYCWRLTRNGCVICRNPATGCCVLSNAWVFCSLGTLLWLVWILGQMRGVDAIVQIRGMLLLIAILAWIKGSFWTPVSSWRSRILAVASMFVVLLLAAGAYGFVTKPSRLVWQQFSQANLDDALASGRPVFIDFTADWCLTCKTNERFAIDTSKVRQEFSKRNVVMLKADWTKGDPEITEILKQHGRAGVPMYLVYPGGGQRDATGAFARADHISNGPGRVEQNLTGCGPIFVTVRQNRA